MLEELKEEHIVNKVGGRFKLSTLIQKRMIALNQGSRPLVDARGLDKMSIVIQEIMQDKIYLDMSGNLHGLFASIGSASYLVLFASAVADLVVFRRRKVADPALRLAGFALIVLVASAMVQKFDPGRKPSPAVGSGGYIGAATAAFLEGQFGLAGMILILLAFGLVGLVLCHDILIAWPIHESLGLNRPLRVPAS